MKNERRGVHLLLVSVSPISPGLSSLTPSSHERRHHRMPSIQRTVDRLPVSQPCRPTQPYIHPPLSIAPRIKARISTPIRPRFASHSFPQPKSPSTPHPPFSAPPLRWLVYSVALTDVGGAEAESCKGYGDPSLPHLPNSGSIHSTGVEHPARAEPRRSGRALEASGSSDEEQGAGGAGLFGEDIWIWR